MSISTPSPATRSPVDGNVDGRGALILPPATDSVAPFRVEVPQAALDDLRLRLNLIRWPDRETVDDWSQGVPLAAAQSLVDYWLHEYDWRRFESRLNSYPQFRTRIDGVGIYFIHARSPHPRAMPILLTHGWPGSVIEFLNVIDRLTDPTKFGGKAEDAFHVVIPAIPGYGFSDKPVEQGWNPARIARAWAVLMTERLGYERWVAQGGDWGSAITTALASQKPQGLLAAHVNLPMVVPAVLPECPTEEERQALEDIELFVSKGTGYADQMNTRPQTIGYALNDSPLALAAWMYEKFWNWTDNNGYPEDALTRDQMLDDISLYWFTGTGTSSARLYWEGVGSTIRGADFFSGARSGGGRIEVPMGASLFPAETYRPPRAWAEAAWANLFYWNEVEKGGHFAAFEQPDIFAREMWRAFRAFRG
ncbi:epoxide hydrolase [Pseudomonas gingeri NCPPB 3146 = LMG 5327]|uniref:Alpha/beta fold hydrolase n=2 Tax=Pseudomonas gingeri TaxID=117681 RepID=A0A7Y7Y5R1_9PSED|nr:epoxide hydrolase [Pseudomonas gingeri]NWC18361.1 alpha/beta fold hydrolase [Pseudomonas gingeri]NWE68904.1 alpha/beta fold hydrolase [Pseudomonas gingeri]PNQ91407.1 epoxide hydrolase [Pseudomonas gingeri NCPPB 3146 = LMG 5327]